MLCDVCCQMSKRDYKVATTDGIELEPLGGTPNTNKENKANCVKYAGDSSGVGVAGRRTRNGVAVCSQKRALCVTAIVLGALIGTALVIAYAGPQNDCSCAGKMPAGYTSDHYNNSIPFNPIATNGEPFPWHEWNLPNNVRPIRYSLTIHPNLTTLDVKGQVTIEFHVEKETNFIVLHIQDLNVTEKAIVGPKGYALKINRVLEFPPRQQLYIELKDKLRKKNNFTLNLKWFSRLSSEPEGFYVDQYNGPNDQKRFLAATVFRPGGARRAFPCFDEPHLRAPFRISVFRDRFHIGLSNSIVYATDDVGFYMGTGLLRDDFIETPAVAPDAIAWAVSDFQRVSLEPKITYQVDGNRVMSATTAGSTVPLTTKIPFISEHLTDKRPIKNFITSSLTNSLMQKWNDSVVGSGGGKAENQTSQRLVDGKVQTAPTYTFYASNNILENAHMVLHTSRDVLEYLQIWLHVAYPLTKLDFVALPSLDRDMISSLGLISIQTSFLQNSNAITTEHYHNSVIKIAEAIIQQFFGGITSQKIWKHSWLWDGIIKYLARYILITLRPEWPLDEMHLLHITNRAMDIDAIQRWDSVIRGTSDDGKIDEFYVDKSAAILSMLHSAIDEDNFRHCLGAFLNTYRFQTAEPMDLWSVCTKRMNNTKNIKEMMNIWTTLDGFPLLNVTKSGQNLTITQKVFQPMEFQAISDDSYMLNFTIVAPLTTHQPPVVIKKRSTFKWMIPINYITDRRNITDKFWLYNNEITVQLPVDIKWIKVNAGQNGYYRVLYDDQNWMMLINTLKLNHTALNSKDRIGLISDAFTLCHANLLSCQITMNLLLYLPNERNWGPMATTIQHLERWRRILKYSECFLILSEYVKSILASPIRKIGWSDVGNDDMKLLRPEILLASVLWEDSESIVRAKNLLHNFLVNGTVIPANLKEVAYTGAVLSGDYTYWQYCWERYTTLRKMPEKFTERVQLLKALGKTKDAWLQNRLLSYIIMLPSNEVVHVLEAISGTPTGGAMACRFLQAKWFDLQSKIGAGSIHFAKVISAITQYGATKFDYDELKSLVHRFGDGPGIRILNMTLQMVAANVEWVSRSHSAIFNWVVNHEPILH